MIDAGISDNQYMRECLGVDEVKKPSPSTAARLSEDEASLVVNTSIKSLETCYASLLDRSKSLSLVPEGMVNPSLKLGPKGEVTDVIFEPGQIVDLSLLECIKTKLRTLHFKKSLPGTSVHLQYRLIAAGSKKSAKVILAKGFPKLVGPAYSLSDQDILAVFRRHVPKVRRCYEDVLKASPNSSGRVTVDLVVKSNGRVRKVLYKENTITDKKFASCVTAQLKNFIFPKTGTVKDTVVNYPPFVFAPENIKP